MASISRLLRAITWFCLLSTIHHFHYFPTCVKRIQRMYTPFASLYNQFYASPSRFHSHDPVIVKSSENSCPETRLTNIAAQPIYTYRGLAPYQNQRLSSGINEPPLKDDTRTSNAFPSSTAYLEPLFHVVLRNKRPHVIFC